MKKYSLYSLLIFFTFSVSLVNGQDGDLTAQLRELQKSIQASEHRYDALEKRIDDVHVLEVETLIRELKAADKKIEYEIFKDIPGGHSFDRIDLKQSREIRLRIWTFLAKHLNPPSPLKNLKDMEKAAYLP